MKYLLSLLSMLLINSVYADESINLNNGENIKFSELKNDSKKYDITFWSWKENVPSHYNFDDLKEVGLGIVDENDYKSNYENVDYKTTYKIQLGKYTGAKLNSNNIYESHKNHVFRFIGIANANYKVNDNISLVGEAEYMARLVGLLSKDKTGELYLTLRSGIKYNPFQDNSTKIEVLLPYTMLYSGWGTVKIPNQSLFYRLSYEKDINKNLKIKTNLDYYKSKNSDIIKHNEQYFYQPSFRNTSLSFNIDYKF